MITILLALALGQQCQIIDGRQVCSAAQPQAQRYSASAQVPERFSQYIVAIRNEFPNQGHGFAATGTIVRVDGKRALVLTVMHVVREMDTWRMKLGRTRGIHRGNVYELKLLGTADTADLAAFEMAAPPGIGNIRMAKSQPDAVWAMGYGPSADRLHYHYGTYQNSAKRPFYATTTDPTYNLVAEEGDSGGPAFNANSEFAGVLWGGDKDGTEFVALDKIHRFLSREYCFRFFRRRQSQPSGGVSVSINDPSTPLPVAPAPIPVPPPDPTPVPVPVAPVIVTPSPITSVAVGPVGPAGPPGASAPPVDLSPINIEINSMISRLNALEAQTTTVAVKQPNGTQSPSREFRPQVDPASGRRTTGILLDLNPPPTPSK